MGEDQLAEQVTIEIDPLCEGIDYSHLLSRARFEELSWTTSEFHGTRGEVPARQGIEQKNVHDVVLVESST